MRWLLLAALPLAAQTCETLRHHGKTAEAKSCYAALARSPEPALRAEGLRGLGQYQEANDAFRAAVTQHPKDPRVRVRWGRLLLERFNKDDAGALFSEALEIKPDDAGALLGLALVHADGFESKAVELARKAAAADPRLTEAREVLARLALEDGDEPRAASEADKALEISAEALDALAVRASIDFLHDQPTSPWMDRALKLNPAYGEGYAIAARFFILNRRYREGIAFYRKAIELDPELWHARSELGINLMRLAEDEGARRQLELCYSNGFKDPATVNTLRLLDSYKNFVFDRQGSTVLKLDKKEAGALRPYIEAELKRAMAAYEKKYQFKLSRPVQVEVYPNHPDFEVRTLGMPGLGALGVSFGYVVAMDSPSSRPPGSFHWASTLWHELSHVYVLSATDHRVPRWFTEGLAVHEETASAAPDWGDRMTPEVIAALKDKKLLPVSQLDRGFIRPSYPAQVVVSYFQAGRICDFIAKTWGEPKLTEMVRAFAAKKSTPEAIRAALDVGPEELDKRFFAWLEADTKTVVAGFDQWGKRIRALREAYAAEKYDDVIRDAPAVRDLYPDYVEHGSAYEMLAQAYLKKENKPAAVAELERYARQGGRNPASLKKLAELLEQMGRAKEAAAALERLNYIAPLDEDLHQRLGNLWLAQGKADAAVREYTVALALKPLDQAASHYNLARAYRAAARLDSAKEQLLLALEAAPGFRPAQKMLLELSQ